MILVCYWKHLHLPDGPVSIFLFINLQEKGQKSISSTSHLVSNVDAAAVQVVDVFFTFVHEAADQPVVAEDDAGHLGDVLVALVLADVATVIHQTGHQVAPPPLLVVALLYLQACLSTY